MARSRQRLEGDAEVVGQGDQVRQALSAMMASYRFWLATALVLAAIGCVAGVAAIYFESAMGLLIFLFIR